MKQVKIHMLLNSSAAGKRHSKEVEDRDLAYTLAVQREVDEHRKGEERALLEDFENARAGKTIGAATVTLGNLMETAIDIFAPDEKPVPFAF